MIDEIKKFIKVVIGREVGQIFIPERPEFGHYAANVAFVLANLRRAQGENKLPLEIAKELVEKIKAVDGGRLFYKVEAAPPGFINFWISTQALQKELLKILKAKIWRVPGIKRRVINLEFISANPTGPLTMANGRGGFLGDVLANVLQSVGHKVIREYYINDAGRQIEILGESILAALGRISPKEEYYQGAYIKTLANKLKTKILKLKTPEDIGRLAAKELLRGIKQSVKKSGIKFDVWFSEYQKLRRSGLIKKIIDILNKKGLVDEHDGAKWLKSSDIADEQDRVLVKSSGEPTYFLSDIAYHYDKFIKRKFDEVIDIWGADHHDYAARLKVGVKAIDIDSRKLHIIITQLVRLVEGGKESRMSKRKGAFVTLDELIEQVGVDAARFFFLMHSPDTHMDFDLTLAKEQSLKNPVYYMQYAYVRAKSVLAKANGKSPVMRRLEKLNSDSEIILLNEMVKLPYIIRQIADDYQVHRLTHYALGLARAFHNFYEQERVLGVGGEIEEARLALVAAVKIIFEKLFKLMGIAAPKKM